jgi:hypothetical protein
VAAAVRSLARHLALETLDLHEELYPEDQEMAQAILLLARAHEILDANNWIGASTDGGSGPKK